MRAEERGHGSAPKSGRGDSVAPGERRPHYWDRCERMGFVELRKFIDANLKAASDPGPDVDLPRSKDEFLALADMLDSKLDEMREDAPDIPPRPSPPPEYARYVSPSFDPSQKLESAQEELDHLWDRLEKARRARRPSRPHISDLQQRIRSQQEVVELLESSEREEHKKRYVSYRKAADAYEPLLRSWRVEEQKARKVRRSLTAKSSFVARIRGDIDRIFKTGVGMPTKSVYWRLLPPAEVSGEELRRYYSDLQAKNPHAQYDWGRIEKALELGPNQRYEEIGGVEGYIVFTFPYTSSVLLECPKVGNAIYVVHSDWERWSRMSKQELMADGSGEVVRIPHQGRWLERVKQELKNCDPSGT